MNTATAVARRKMTAAEAFVEIEAQRIALIPAFDGRVWVASIERVKNKKRFTKPDMETVSASAPTAFQAVEQLAAKLDADESGYLDAISR